LQDAGPPVGEDQQRPPVSFGPQAVWVLIGILAVAVIVFALWTILIWSIAQHVYSTKSDQSWFGITFYHGYTFLVGGLLALLVIHPRVGKSDLSGLVTALSRRSPQYGDEIQRPLAQLKPGVAVWGLWQFVKWLIVFGYFVVNDSFPTLGPVMNAVAMLTQGIGNWADVPRLLVLPLFPASGGNLISMMPTMEVQYYLLYYAVSAALTVFALRMILRLLKNLPTRGSTVWTRNILSVALAITLALILGAPYWYMNVATPYLYGLSILSFVAILFGYFYFGKRRDSLFPSGGLYKGVAIVIIALLVIQSGALAFIYLNWNNNYVPYQFDPGIQKEISVTRWAAGIQNITEGNVTALPTSNSSTILNVVRQWDQTAANVTNTKAIGAYNWMALGSSEIVYLNNTEYWVSPTTVHYPATDWISQHLIYTHAAKIEVINTYNGSEIPVTNAYGVPTAPDIYYGEGPGFTNDVYVHVPGYDEIGNASYTGAADYNLTGWQKSLWMIGAEGQVGFAFSHGDMQMLWNRNVFDRVQSILIPGLVEDPAAYLVTDGQSIYYAVQVYIAYPLQSGFAGSPYLRFFGVALVNVSNGDMQFYNVSNSVGVGSSDFITRFYSTYYSSWQAPPAWLVPQLRYPEQLLGSQSSPGQLDVDFQFHVNDPFVWRSGSQFYQRPTTNSSTGATVNGVQYIPWAVGNKTYFAATQLVHYENAPSQNLAGMYIAYGGDRLGQIFLYQNPSSSTTIIGPSAAENALTTNQEVRTQLTLLPNYRFGSYLLYSVGGTLTYFVAVYTNPGSSGVVTQLPFMTAVSPETDLVGVGPNATAAYRNLLAVEAGTSSTSSGTGSSSSTGTTTTTTSSTSTSSTVTLSTSVAGLSSSDEAALVSGISKLAATASLSVVNATTVSPNVFIQVAKVSVSQSGVSGALTQVSNMIQSYGPGSAGGSLYVWVDGSGNLNAGIFQVKGGVTDLYYVTITA